jgi:micrococcal nuclease
VCPGLRQKWGMTGTMHIVLSAILAAFLLFPAPAEARQACRAIDGDSLVCGSERIRILGLDAPELRGRCPAEVRLARAARARMQELVARGITIERRGRDRHRRTLAVVRVRGGQDVADIMIRERLARAYDGRGPRRGWC